MGTNPFAAAKLPSPTNAKVPNEVEATLPSGTPAKLPLNSAAKLPNQCISAAERLRRLEEAKAFLQAHLAAGPQPARTLLKAARAAGIATRTLYRAKDVLGVRPERSGGFGAYGLWTWYPPEVGVPTTSRSALLHTLTGERG